MKFNIYGRFQIDVRREKDAWVVYRSEHGKRTLLNDVVIPADVEAGELATYLDDIFHELARMGEQVEPMPEAAVVQTPVASLCVTIQRWVDDEFPGVVACTLMDADGRLHDFVEKAAIVSAANLSSASAYPRPGHIACVVRDEWQDALGRGRVRVDTGEPWGVASAAGDTIFTVLRQQIVGAA